MTREDALLRGRDAFERRAWRTAHEALSEAGEDEPLDLADLERLAIAAHMLGRDGDSAEHWERAHHEALRTNETRRAVRAAFWLAYELLDKGEAARSGGWISRARRLLDQGCDNCAEEGYLLLPDALRSFAAGDHAAALEAFGRAADFGDRFGDRDLVTLGRHGQGRVLIRSGETARGLRLLDEAMVAVTTGDTSPMVAGDVYCGVLSACQEIFDWRRAQEWTTALGEWCASQPDLVLYRGQCLVRRAEIMQLHGAWATALDEAQQACERLSHPPGQPGIGAAYYQKAELHRLRGEFAKAEDAYRQASERGRRAHPGLAQLRLARGEVDVAAASIRAALAEVRDRGTRSRMLAAAVDILVAARDLDGARAAANELAEHAAALDAVFLRAISLRATAAVLLAEGEVPASLAASRQACSLLRELRAPHEAARAGMLLGLACRQLGDHDTAEMELQGARAVFQQLGAAPDLVEIDSLCAATSPGATGALTVRELEVLRLIAAGETNRAIARDLGISEKTVARHVSNIFTKLDLSSRSAATAYAYRHRLV
jgi:DNA-binding CsgD family transcriptional regulator